MGEKKANKNMTEMTYMPNPIEIIERLNCVDLDLVRAGNEEEKAKLRSATIWSIALSHCFDLQVIPRRDRGELEDFCDEVGRLGAAILFALDSGRPLQDIATNYFDLKQDLLYICNELDSRLAAQYIKATKCQT